ncbi:MAG: (2Fe-2S)-binding protein [Kiloniellales bacterium]|nr:(2Fe-2S)-binding protein [Kiloniellales bacterium]
MYVCICNGYRDAELRQLAQEGVSCAVEAYCALGNGPCCGRCLDSAQQIINETRGALTLPGGAGS